MLSMIRQLWVDQEGGATVEYALLLAVVVVGCVGAWASLRDRIVLALDEVENSFSP